jgi:hypothetical protein
MIGFVYLWYDRKHKRFCLGSHVGHPDDGYITKTGGAYFRNAYRKRRQDFKRRIIEVVIEGDLKAVRNAEQRWLNMIKPDEFGSRYYNYMRDARGFDSVTSRLAVKIAHKVKDERGKSVNAVKAGKIGGRIGGPKGGKVAGLINGPLVMRRLNAAKDPDGKSTNARRAGRLGGSVEKTPEEKAIIAKKISDGLTGRSLSEDHRNKIARAICLIRVDQKQRRLQIYRDMALLFPNSLSFWFYWLLVVGRGNIDDFMPHRSHAELARITTLRASFTSRAA